MMMHLEKINIIFLFYLLKLLQLTFYHVLFITITGWNKKKISINLQIIFQNLFLLEKKLILVPYDADADQRPG
jgi:hypothetical protein